MSAHGGDELRPVTALFADIVGSTSLGERLTPGEVKALIGECVSRRSRAVEEFGGIIQAYTGDGICAYFGVPAAHEDDPERAARAALRSIEVATEYAQDVEAAWGLPDFNVRVGINSGQTGVGMVGGAVPQAVALGDTTNVAARLEGAAKPGTIAVGSGTAQRLAHSFALESLGEIHVKGRTDAVAAWRLVGPRPTAEPDALAPLVGREAEMDRLSAMAEELRAGRGQVLLLVGEAGIGKTRLLTELRGLLDGKATWLQGACSSYGQELLSGPFVQMLRSWLGVQEGEPEVAVRMRLRAKLGALLGANAGEAIGPLGRLLGVKLDSDVEQRLQGQSPQALGSAIDLAYREWVEAVAAGGPLVIAVDDLNWSDPSTRKLAEDLLAVTDRGPLLVAAAFRPHPPSEASRYRMEALGEYAHRTTELTLGPLSPEASRRLADVLMGDRPLDEATREGMILRSEGNPLFLEELLRSVQGAAGGDRQRSWSVSIRHLLPPTLESLFVARIDRLAPGARRLAQAAAVIGRDFPVRVLERMGESEDVEGDLAVLLRADLVREVRRYPDLECRFRHGLVQEAALSTLTPGRLRELNGRVGAAYEELYAGALDDHLESLAYHYYRSDDPSRALGYLERAAERAEGMAAAAQARELLGRAKRLAAKIGDATAGDRIDRRLAAMGPG
jgi:class 3 adenylate cyclase